MSDLIECLDGLTAEDITRVIAKTANGQPFYLQTSGLGGFVAEYQAVYDSLTMKPSNAIATEQNNMVKTIVNAGTWSKLDLFYLFAQTTNVGGESLKNWINPGVFDATVHGGALFTALEGWTGDGINGYINSNWRAVSDAIHYTQNDCSILLYIRNNVAEDFVDCGLDSGANNNRITWVTRSVALNRFTGRLNCNVQTTYTHTDSRGTWVLVRPDAANQILYKNGVSVDASAVASSGVTDVEFFILARNDGSGTAELFCTKQIAAVAVGAELTQTDVTALNAIEVYMDSNGKGVAA